MNPQLTWEAVEAMVADRRRQADSPRPPAYPGVRSSPPRKAAPGAERSALQDSADVPTGPVLVAKTEGEAVEKLPLGRDALAGTSR
jgi:hypothetical protein